MKECPQCRLYQPDNARLCDCGHDFSRPSSGPTTEAPDPRERKARRGAGWFYWVAGLSVVNAFLAFVGNGDSFVIGLGAAGFLRVFFAGMLGIPAPILGPDPRLLPVLVLECLLAFSIAGLGYAASRGLRTAFVVGIAIYGLDTVLTVVERSISGLIFHAIALVFMTEGLLALHELRKSQASAPDLATVAKPPRLLWGLVAIPVLFFGLFAFVGMLALVLANLGLAKPVDMVLARAPESFTPAQRDRLREAFLAVDARFEKEGGISREEASRMNTATVRIVDRPAGETASPEELDELTQILEEVGRISPRASTP